MLGEDSLFAIECWEKLDGLARFPRHIPVDEWGSSFNPCTIMAFFCGFCLSWMGRLPEAIEAFGRHRRLCQEDGTPEFTGYSQVYSCEAHYRALDPERALASARQVEDLSRRVGDPPSLAAYNHLTFAFAHLAAERAVYAIEAARRALELLGRWRSSRRVARHAERLTREPAASSLSA
jgi:hypothetical protein